jgi:3-carboxy-cis,cis-muconate cycloisomerase
VRGELFTPILAGGAVLDATSDEAWLQAMLDAEAALARAEAEVGVIGAEAAAQIVEACRVENFDVTILGQRARAGGNPVIPLVAALRSRLAGDARDAVHFGATSQDILDTAMVLVARRALAVIDDDLVHVTDLCAGLARRHRTTVMTGRTLLQPAVPITFGLKAAGWLVASIEAHLGLAETSLRLSAQLGGAAGTLALLGEDGPVVAEAYAAHLGLSEPVVPWHASRQRIAALGSALATVTGAMAKIATDLALLAQPEIGEVRFRAVGGSSTMPHKRNPVEATVARAAAIRSAGLVGVLLGALVTEHERPVGAWHAEWEAVNELLVLAGGAAAAVRSALAGLEVDAAAMAANLDATGGLVVAERFVGALTATLGGEEARSVVERLASEAQDPTAEAEFADLVRTCPEIVTALGMVEIERLLEPDTYLGSSDAFIERALATHHAVS